MNIVIIGGGLAGASAVQELVDRGHTGDITLIGAEPHPPYERPPLSKGLLLGSATPGSAEVEPTSWYADHGVELVTGTAASDIDLARRVVSLADRQVPYDRLLLATGSRPRRLAAVDESGADVHYLRTIDDALALRPRLGERLLIIGAGWIGLEVAAAAREAGGSVTVVEASPLPLAKVLGPRIAPVFADLHREHGVDLRLGTSIAGLTHDGTETTARLDDGTAVTVDLVLVGIGAEPEDELAARAGLAVDHGILVDGNLRTSDPHVYAAGDVAQHLHPRHGRLRVEHWDTAMGHGRHAAGAMLGEEQPYLAEPYFFTDQYDLGMEYVGHVGTEGHADVVIRGDLPGRKFSVLWIHGDRIAAGMHVNDWDAIGTLRDLIGRDATPAAHDPSVPLSELLD